MEEASDSCQTASAEQSVCHSENWNAGVTLVGKQEAPVGNISAIL